MIKVLHVFNQLNQGGIEHVVINLMKNIDRSEIEFHFALMSGKEGLLDAEVRQLGGHIHYFTSGKKGVINVGKNLSNIIDKYGPFEVVHSHSYFFSGYILYIAKMKGVPIRIAHAHDTYKGEKTSFIRKIYESGMQYLINKNSTYKLGVSAEACLHVFGKIDDTTFIVNNAIDLENYKLNNEIRNKKRTELRISNDEKLIINIGRFEDQKDHEYLIDVFSKLLERTKNFKLLLIGNGSLKENVINKVKRLGFSKKVLFLENRNDINELLMAADIFLMTSKYEGLPIVLIEAQAAGIPCIISSNITHDAVIGKNVYSLKKDKINDWVDKTMALRNTARMDNSLALKDAGFDIKEVASFVQELYLSKK